MNSKLSRVLKYLIVRLYSSTENQEVEYVLYMLDFLFGLFRVADEPD